MRDISDQQPKPEGFPAFFPVSSGPLHERKDAAQHRQHILATARTLFAEHGVNAVSMHQIALTAGVGQGTLYRRYAHKGLLCLALLEESMMRFQRTVLSYLEEKATGQTSPVNQIIAVLDNVIAFNEENAALLGAITDASCGEHRDRGPLYLWLRQIMQVLLQQIAGSELDYEYVADAILAPLAIDVYLYQRQTLGFTPERIGAGMKQFLLHGLSSTMPADTGNSAEN